jgi:hypothetical protein
VDKRQRYGKVFVAQTIKVLEVGHGKEEVRVLQLKSKESRWKKRSLIKERNAARELELQGYQREVREERIIDTKVMMLQKRTRLESGKRARLGLEEKMNGTAASMVLVPSSP